MIEKRARWAEEIVPSITTDRFWFIDECGVNTDMIRRYGRSVGGTRVSDHAPMNTPKSTTILSAVRSDGTTAGTHFEGAVNGEMFLAYLREHLTPLPEEGDVVVMDNLSSHRMKGVAETILSAGAVPLYLPPYSPDLNPVEHVWSKIKAFIRKLRPRTVEVLSATIDLAFTQITGKDCDGWFSNCGYSI